MAFLPISFVCYRTDLIVKQYYNWDPSADQCSPSSKAYHGHSVSTTKIRYVFFKLWESNFKIHFKEVVLDLLAPICKREKSSIHSRGFFPLEVSLPPLDGGVDRSSTEAFLPWLDLVCPLLTKVTYPSLLVPPPRWDGDAPEVDLMASQTDVQFLTLKTFVWFLLLLWCHLGWRRVAFLECFPSSSSRGSIHVPCVCAHSRVQSWTQ